MRVQTTLEVEIRLENARVVASSSPVLKGEIEPDATLTALAAH